MRTAKLWKPVGPCTIAAAACFVVPTRPAGLGQTARESSPRQAIPECVYSRCGIAILETAI